MRVYCYNTVLLIEVINDPPWNKHQPENTGLFPFNGDDKKWQKSLSVTEDKVLFRIVKKIFNWFIF